MLSRYTRQFLTAGKADEVVADSGGPRNGHSVFTGHLLNALDGEMQTTDGLISANALMAHVYSRVANDPHSLQAPHYGFLAGDGDLFFTIPSIETDPSKPKDTGDVLIEVPPGLSAPEEVTVAPPLLERVKEYLSDRKHRIALDDLVMRELRAAQQRLGEEHFAVQGQSITKQDFAERLVKYEEAMSDPLRIAVLLGRWAEDEQQGVIRQMVNVIAGQIEAKGGLRLWLCFDHFEILSALVFSDLSGLAWGHPGRFAWKYRSRGRSDNPFAALIDEAKQEGNAWAPLRAGLFRGSHAHFAAVAERFQKELLDTLSWF